ncbi:MAG: dihydroxyacetone kinase subunit L [Methylococcales bacterium]|nr:dihydroxyacetone kinase subunit L [Methylococcales bacterium]
MEITPNYLPDFIDAIIATIREHEDEVTALDQAIGDGDHVINLQRGLEHLKAQAPELSQLSWEAALKKIGISLLGNMGGASGSLFGTLFISMSKTLTKASILTLEVTAHSFSVGIDATKKRGKSDIGAKTMLDVLIPVEQALQQAFEAEMDTDKLHEFICDTALAGVESTRDMVATKGRAAFMGERTKGHLDAGAKTSQLIICTIIKVLESQKISA